MAKQVQVILKRRYQGRKANQVATIKALGLRKLNDSVIVEVSDTMNGMINVVEHLVEVKEV